MRAFLISSTGAVCATALALPVLTLPAAAAGPPPSADLPGSTQSLPLSPLPDRLRAGSAVAAQGTAPRDVRPFSLLGVVWDDAGVALHGKVKVRTRAAGSHIWSGWQDLEADDVAHAPDPSARERSDRALRGSTAPLWVGASDGVEARVLPETDASLRSTPLPGGLRLELVDPGPTPKPATSTADAPAPPSGSLAQKAPASALPLDALQASPLFATPEAAAASAVNAGLAPLGASVIPALSKQEASEEAGVYGVAKPYVGARPPIISRKGWGADESLREKEFAYTKSIKVAFIHHSGTGNGYTCAQAPAVLRGIYRYHVESNGWRDIGYNFAVDKCGRIYEGRAGGVVKPVLGAHTLGFNGNSMGIAVLGTYSASNPPAAAVTAIAKLTAWKLGLYGMNPKAQTALTSEGGNKFKKGTSARLNVISGHRDGFDTDCPGARLYGKLGTVRNASAKLQGR
ncbi:N-acetylmuramoyl-L-alanine amidase [Streptomyces sp. NPDC059176]|uniref:N-acetylmuramoyl-L-alanine amidase n=1 Tax=unclassified Streptomyces TaxID=2593676 RepID=UPI0036CB1C51